MTPNQDDRIGVPKDELEFEPVEARPPKRHWGRWLAILIILILGAGAGWHYLGDKVNLGQQKGVPVVRADISPVKIKPADPGGLDVPDRDKLVYDRLNGEGTSTEVESLLPPPEEPMEVPVSTDTPEAPESTAPTTLQSADEPEPATATPAIQAPVALEPSTIIDSTSMAPEAPPPPPVPVVTVEAAELVAPPMPEPAAQPTPAPAVTPTTTPTIVVSADGQFRIQLAALRTHGSAESEWKRLKNAHPDILGPLTLFVVMVDLGGDQGIYYRLRAGNLNSKELAKVVCDKLAARNVACLVIRPGK